MSITIRPEQEVGLLRRTGTESRAWVQENIEIDDQDALDVQTAAVYCAFGCKTRATTDLLYSKEDWCAMAWSAEASSLRDENDDAYGYVEQCLDLIMNQKPDPEAATKVIDSLFDWMGHWPDLSRNVKIRLDVIWLRERIPGGLSYDMISATLALVICKEGLQGIRLFLGLLSIRQTKRSADFHP